MALNLKEYCSRIEPGQMQRCRNIAVVPLFLREEAKLDYLTLKEALGRKCAVVSEVGVEGSVPELLVDVEEGVNVLILDGEELYGARQNRVLNASIFLRGKSRTVVPVSCTEQGRWHAVSRSFYDSGHQADYAMRAAKNMSVSQSLRAGRKYHSDQGIVWDCISDLQLKAKVMSRTRAMRDIYVDKKAELDEYIEKFRPLPGQRGLLVFVNGEAAGLDLVSREAAYRVYHEKLLRSYCIHAVYSTAKDGREPDAGKVHDFLDFAASSRVYSYKSVGVGDDYRLEGRRYNGSALEVDGEVLHLSFLAERR